MTPEQFVVACLRGSMSSTTREVAEASSMGALPFLAETFECANETHYERVLAQDEVELVRAWLVSQDSGALGEALFLGVVDKSRRFQIAVKGEMVSALEDEYVVQSQVVAEAERDFRAAKRFSANRDALQTWSIATRRRATDLRGMKNDTLFEIRSLERMINGEVDAVYDLRRRVSAARQRLRREGD